MPSNWLYIDTNFPSFTQKESASDKIETMQDYLFMLVEQLRYTLHNLDLSNMNKTAADEFVKQITDPIYGEIKDAEGNITQVALVAEGLAARIGDAEGNITQLQATAQGLSALAALLCLLMNKNAPVHARQFCPDPRLCKKLLTVGVSPFGLSMSASVLIMLNNWQCIRYGGAGAVATYAILSYVLGALQPLLSGIGEGIQPLVSFCHGAGDLAAQHHLQRRALRLLLAVATVLCAGTFLAREQLPLLFGASSETARESVPALLFAVASLPLWGVVRLYASCFYATGQTRRSLFFIFGDPLGASPLFLFLLPPMLGVNGIWAAAPATQALLFLCLLGMFRQDGRRGVQRT